MEEILTGAWDFSPVKFIPQRVEYTTPRRHYLRDTTWPTSLRLCGYRPTLGVYLTLVCRCSALNRCPSNRRGNAVDNGTKSAGDLD
jgi:hypothetical protein